MIDMRKIVVVSPVKNEERILRSFLSLTLSFADHVVLAYQPSIDDTLKIAGEFPNVDVVINDTDLYSEKVRAEMLIAAAREKYGKSSVIIALDADEIVIPQSSSVLEWEKIRRLPPGTSIEFEKPDILPGGKNCVRFPRNYTKLGYVDDGCFFEAQTIHTQRVPLSPSGNIYRCDSIKFLHINLIRDRAHRAKRRFYACIEAINKTQPWYRRVINYKADIDWSKAGDLEQIPAQWLDDLMQLPDSPLKIDDEPPFWHDFEVLRLMRIHGYRSLWWEDVWDADWELIRLIGKKRNYQNLPDDVIKPLPLYIRSIRSVAASLILAFRNAKKSISRT